jgi:hypothetical protein
MSGKPLPGSFVRGISFNNFINMRTIIFGTLLCVLMSWPIVSRAQSGTNSEPVYSAKNFGETKQARDVERQMRTRDYSSFNQKVEKAVKDAVNGESNKSSSGSTNSSSSNSSSGSGNSSSNKGSSTSTNSGSNQSQTKNSNSEDNGKCTDCSKQAEALKNSLKQ